MLFPALLLTVFIRNCLCDEESGPRIIGGAAVRAEDYPSVVFVLQEGGPCGGSMIALDWVLTAAHCINKKDLAEGHHIFVRAGFNNTDELIQVRNATRAIIHPKFDKDKMESLKDIRYDIALVQLPKPFKKTSVLKVVKLPTIGYTNKCTVATACGIGFEGPDPFPPFEGPTELRKRPLKCVQLHLTGKKKCHGFFGESTLLDEKLIFTMEEKGMKDACQGDSGGPLFCKDVVIGVISTGALCGQPGICASYTRVEDYLDFIKNYTQVKNYTQGSKKNVTRMVGTGPRNTCHVWWLPILLVVTKYM